MKLSLSSLIFLAFSVFGSTKPCILLIGGAGYVGSHVNEFLYRSGYPTIVLDNLSRGDKRAVKHGIFIEGECSDKALLRSIFSNYPVQGVMHFAAFMNVGESMKHPLMYYVNNVSNTLALFEEMKANNIKYFIFSSSCTVYGNEMSDHVSEQHRTSPINPYGKSKWMVEMVMEDLERAFNFKYCTLRYFNAAGGDPFGVVKNYKQSDPTLIPSILRSIKEGRGKVQVHGVDYPTPDGTCIRDFVHVEDLASAHLSALVKLLKGGASTVYNLGNGRGYSVREVIEAAERVTGQRIEIIQGPKRDGDAPKMVADCSKAKQELLWKPAYSSIDQMIEHAWLAMQHDEPLSQRYQPDP